MNTQEAQTNDAGVAARANVSDERRALLRRYIGRRWKFIIGLSIVILFYVVAIFADF